MLDTVAETDLYLSLFSWGLGNKLRVMGRQPASVKQVIFAGNPNLHRYKFFLLIHPYNLCLS